MKPYQECPRFYKCNVNKCPLDPDIDIRNSVGTDEKCTLAKTIRFRIGSKYSHLLQYQGLTKREWSGKRRWAALSDEERAAKTKLVVETLANWQKSKNSGIVGSIVNV